MVDVYDDGGIRFEYPADWEVELAEGEEGFSVEITSPDGLAFGLVTVDESRPDPALPADEALRALRDEYPTLEASPAQETIDGRSAEGFDVSFFSLDFSNACVIRAFRTDRRTVFVFGQWSDLDDDGAHEAAILALRTTLEETDS